MAVVAGAAALELLIAQEVLNNLVGQLVGQLVGSFIASDLAGIQEESYRLNPSLQITVADVVEGVIKGHIPLEAAQLEASLSGINNDRLRWLIDSAGEPLPLLLASEAWRRGIIPQKAADPNAVSLEKAIRDSRLKNAWTPVIEALQFQLAPIGTVIEGWLRAQLTKQEALDLAFKNGIDEATATLMFKAAGRPPGPQELFTLLNRGLIEESGRGGDNLTLEQGYLETDLKDKWYEKWKLLREYRPPPRTITALQRAGAITDEMALQLYAEEGLTPEMAAIYVKTAHHERTATTRELTKAELVSLYVDQAMTADDLHARLLQRGYTAADVALEIELADLKVDHALKQRAINRVGSLYVGRRIDKQLALTTLDSLKMPSAQRDRLLEIWSLERGDNLKHLTPAEIAVAVSDQWFSPEEGLAELGKLGYGPRDGWIILSNHLKAPVTPTMPTDNLPPN